MSAATFGDLLDLARDHLAAAAGLADTTLRDESLITVARVTGRLALSLSRYLEDIAPYNVAEALTSSDLNASMLAAVDAREAMRMAAESLRAADEDHGVPGSEPPDPLAVHLSAAATSLDAGRDLLRTHVFTGPGGWPPGRDWAEVISSAPVTRALLAEVAALSRQLAFVTCWLSLLSGPDAGIAEPVREGMAGAYHWLLVGCSAITTGQRDDPATAADTELMCAIPVSLPPERQPPQDLETARELAGGVAISAARLRAIAQVALPDEAAWSTALTAESWRWTATGAAVICHISELMLANLAEHPGLAAGTPQAAPRLSAAAGAASDACARWREVAAAWSQMTTETRGLTAPGIADTGDLLVRLGRLAFTDPQWTPLRARHAPLRSQADLAPDTAQAVVVAGALHHAADTVACMGAADLRAVGAAIRAGRVYAPTRTLPEDYDVPYRHGHATPADTAALLDAYQEASAATERVVTELDTVAVTMNTPTRILAAARAATRPVQDASTLHTPGQPGLPVLPGTGTAAGTSQPHHRPGSVEQAIRSSGSPDVILLMRARAIDKLADKLIAEAKTPSQDIDTPGPADAPGRPALLARNPAQVAAKDFPAGRAAPTRGRQGAGSALRSTKVPGRPQAQGRVSLGS